LVLSESQEGCFKPRNKEQLLILVDVDVKNRKMKDRRFFEAKASVPSYVDMRYTYWSYLWLALNGEEKKTRDNY